MREPSDLHEYQKKAVRFQCEHPQSALWLDMGLGKTAITLTSIAHMIRTGQMKAVLIVAPIRVVRMVWRQEALKWSHTNDLTFSMVVGDKDQRLRGLMRRADVYLMNYENLGWLSEILEHYYVKKGRQLPFDGVVWDEISKMKNSATKRVKSFMRIFGAFKWRTGLTGTPASNGYKDLHGQFLVLDGGERLGTSKTAFRQRFYYKQGPYKEVPYDDTEEKIKSLIGDITLEMNAADYNPLPDMIVNDIEMDLSSKDRAMYEQMERDFFVTLDSGTDIELFNRASLTNKCLAGDTLVLTDAGWKPIKEYDGEKVWDGEAWVSSSGLLDQGYKQVVECWGVMMTPDHLVLTERGWREAGDVNEQSSERLNRAEVRLPDCYPQGGQSSHNGQISKGCVAGEMRLRQYLEDDWCKPETQHESSEILRMSSRRGGGERQRIAWDDRASGVGDLAEHAISLFEPERQRLEKLRRSWHQGMQTMARVIRKLLVGHERHLPRGSDIRTDGQSWELFTAELPLAVSPATVKQPTNECLYRHADWSDNRGSSGTAIQTQTHHYLQAPGTRMGWTGTDTSCRVYDLANCGPRRRFTVMGRSGEVFLAHNCLQFSNGAVYPIPGLPMWEAIHDLKLDALEDILEEANGQPVLCAYAFRSDAERIMHRFKELRPVNLTSCKSDKSLSDAMRRWRDGDCTLMIGHPACLHPRTQVLTERRGWVRLDQVQLDDRVFDGVEFVSHHGFCYSGFKEVIDRFGILMTPNHRLRINGEWVEAQHVGTDREARREAIYRGEVPNTGSGEMRSVRRRTGDASSELRQAREGVQDALHQLRGRPIPSDDRNADMENLAGFEMEGQGQGGPELRGSGHFCMWGVVGLQSVLRGYDRRVLGRSDHREDRREWPILQGQLQVGQYLRPAGEQAEQSSRDIQGRTDTSGRVVSPQRVQQDDVVREIEPRHDRRRSRSGCDEITIRQEQRPEKHQAPPEKAHVYDLLDCGPRNRFLIRNDDGEMFMSHNSMGHGIDGLQELGHTLAWYGLNWSLDLYNQFNARIRRQGQGAPVICHRLLVRDTLDRAQAEALDDKAVTETALRAAIKRYRQEKMR